jgi:hypothetical protein
VKSKILNNENKENGNLKYRRKYCQWFLQRDSSSAMLLLPSFLLRSNMPSISSFTVALSLFGDERPTE